MNAPSEKIARDAKALIASTDELRKATAKNTSGEVCAARMRLHIALDDAKNVVTLPAREKRTPVWLSNVALGALSVLLTISLAGCETLLPHGQTATRGAWPDYETAHAAIERIVPHQTRRAELAASGIDPFTNPAITILNYSDIVQRFAVSATIRREDLDPGILKCLEAGKACTGYAVQLRSSKRVRIGNFWSDVFNFRRVTESTGWTFNALILMVGDLVVYTLDGGQPRIHEEEVTRNPLGPFQETVPSLLLR